MDLKESGHEKKNSILHDLAGKVRFRKDYDYIIDA